MGIKLFSSASYEDTPLDKNPNPNNWKIVKNKQIGNYCVLMINYPNCDNYEGNKILVYQNTDTLKLINRNKGKIDPHFSENVEYKSPIARFEPTENGWIMAITLCETLSL